MKKLILLSIFVFIFSIFICGQNKSDNDFIATETRGLTFTGNVLERRNSYVDWKDSYFSNAVSDIFGPTIVPYGMSIAFEDAGATEKKLDVNAKSVVVKDLLDEVIKYDSRYKWDETNGVVNVSPVNDYQIMDVRIAEFKIDILSPDKSDNLLHSPNKLERKLIETKEFQTYLKERNLIDKIPNADKHGFLFIGFIGRTSHPKISIDLKNATVREILNEIVRQRGFRWTYREFNVVDEGKLYRLYKLKI